MDYVAYMLVLRARINQQGVIYHHCLKFDDSLVNYGYCTLGLFVVLAGVSLPFDSANPKPANALVRYFRDNCWHAPALLTESEVLAICLPF
jgi:hypothetical protein